MQTEVLDNPAVASPGDMADNYTATDGDRVTAVNEEASASIVIGTMVKRGTGARLAKKLTDSHETPMGIVLRGHHYSSPLEIDALEVDTDVFYDALAPGVPMAIGRSGRYAVLIEDDVDVGDEVHVRAVATTGEVAGAFAPSDLGADGINVSAFCEWVEDADVDDSGFGVAILEVHMGLASLSVTDS